MRSDHYNWNLTAPARPSFSLKEFHIMEFLFLLQKACNLQICMCRHWKHPENMLKTFCPKLPSHQKVLKSIIVSKFVNTSWIFLSHLSISWETLPMDKNTKMFGLCVYYTCVYNIHIFTHPTMETAEVPLALLSVP